MEWKCNINRRGRVLRSVLGLIMIAGGVYLLITGDHDFWAIGLCAVGAFGLFEGIVGWCALRAIGFGTPF